MCGVQENKVVAQTRHKYDATPISHILKVKTVNLFTCHNVVV